MSKTTIIYHSADYDGIFCREIARKFVPDAELIGWNFGDPLIPFPAEGMVYVLDLSPDVFDKDAALIDNTRLIWIDHHKSAIEKWSAQIQGYRIDGVAACRLAWQWFTGQVAEGDHSQGSWLPSLADYRDRIVTEPRAVRLAGEYDIWDKRDPDAETLQYGLRSLPLTPEGWTTLLDGDIDILVGLLHDGSICQRYAQKVDAELVKHKSFGLNWEGLNWIALNTGRFNSLTFAAVDVPESGHDALLGFMFNGKCWTVSLYHAKHRTDLDLSQIAVKHGGGGHRGACGFTCAKLPFM